MPRKRAAPAQRHIDAPGLDRLAVISAELTEGPTRTRGARGSAGDQVETEGRVAKRPRLARPGQDECATAEEARVMSMYLHRSMQQLSQLNADLSVLWPIINSKQFLACQEHDVGQARENSPADANQPQNQQQPAQQTELAPVYQELLRLRASVEGIFGRHVPIPLPSAAGIDMATIMGSFRSIQTAVDALQQQLSLRPNPEEIKTLVSPTLDRLWMQSRLAAEEEMREKLYLWKYKALDLKQSLQATITSRTSAAASSSSQTAVSPTNSLDDTRTLNVLRSALDFVSSLYLLEVVNDPGSNPTNFRKERSMAETASALGEKIYELQLDQRSRMLPPASGYSAAAGQASFIPMYPPREHQPQRYHQQYLDPQTLPSHSVQGVLVVPSEDPSQLFSQQPPQQPLIASEEQVISNGALQPAQLPNQPPPLTPSSAPVNAFDPNFSDASDPPEEDEPLPVVAPIQSSAAEKGTLESEGKTAQEPERVKTNKPISNLTSTPVQAAGALTKSSHNREQSRGKQPSLPRRKMTPTAPRSAGLVPKFQSRTGVPTKQPVGPVERGAVEAVAAAAAARIMGGSGSNGHRKMGVEPAKAENEVLEKVNDSKTAAGSASRSTPPKSSAQVVESVQVASDVPPGQGKSSKANKLPHQSMLYGGVIQPFRGPSDLPSEEESDESESATDAADKSTESGGGSTAQRPTTSATDSGSSTPTSGSGSSIQRGVSTGCAICQKNDSYAQLLLCDNDCGREYHTFCLSPPLSKIPEGDWYCPRCLSVEQVENGNIFKCSASSCDKITGARYCSLHRCREPHCLNRIKAGGFCRRHELFRSRPKRARPPPMTRIALRPSNAVVPEETSLDSSDAGLPISMNRLRLPPRIRALAPAPPPDQAPPPDAETSTEASTKAPTNPTSSAASAKTPPPPPARPKERAKIPLKNIAPKRADPPQGTDSSERPTSPQRTGTAARSTGSSQRSAQRSAPRTTASIIAAAKSAADKAAAERTKSSNVSRS